MKSIPSRRFIRWLLGVTAFGAVLRLAFIFTQAPTTDDASALWTAWGYTLHGETWPTMPHHPPLRNLLIVVSNSLFGGSAVGVKGFSLLFGILLIAATGLLVRRAVLDERAGLFAAGIVALDIVQIVYSRQAINDIHAAFFAVVGAWLVVEALGAQDTRSWRWLLPAAGVSFGLGAASKFYALPLLLACALLLLFSVWKRRQPAEGIVVAASLVPLPFLTYLLTFAPWFGRGYSFGDWGRYQVALVEAMATHARDPIGYKANSHPALWFIRPFYGIAEFTYSAAGPVLSIGVGNPLVWLAVIPALAYSLLVSRQRKRDLLLLVLFAAAYLPLALSPRQIWVLSSVVVIPFAAGIVGSVLSDLVRRYGIKIAWVYGSAVLVTSLLLYPLAIGKSLDFGYLRPVIAQVQDNRPMPRW